MPCGSYYDACGLLCPTNGTVCDKKHVCELGKCVCSRPCDAPEERTCGLAYLDGCGNNCPNKGMLCDDGLIEAKFAVKTHALDGALRVEIDNGHRFVTEVVEAFPGAIQSIAMHKPTLEDVFLNETGVRIGE